MLRVFSQYLSVKDDAAVTAPYRPMGQFVRNKARELQQERQKSKWQSYYQAWESMRDPANGMCQVCNRPLAKDKTGRGRAFCPDPACSSPKNRYTQPRMPTAPY